MIKRTNVTYGQLGKVLRSFGFSRRVFTPDDSEKAYVRFAHKDTGAWITLPLYSDEDHVLDYHMIATRGVLVNFGVADPSVFEAKLKKVG